MCKNTEKEKETLQLIQQLVGKEQIAQASEMGFTIVKVYFDNDYNPIVLASEKKLSSDNYIAFVNNLGMYADKKYRIVGFGNIIKNN